MSAYLFLWNPDIDQNSFENYEEVQSRALEGKPYASPWICPSKQLKLGDLAFVQRTGLRNNGVFARGIVTRAPYVERDKQRVDLSLDSFLALGSEIPRDKIVDRARYDRRWMPMASGNVVPEVLVEAIEALWLLATSKSHVPPRPDPTVAEDVYEQFGRFEGTVTQMLVAHRHREHLIREQKVQDVLRRTGKLECEVPGCGFDFAQVYGEIGVGYAQVHHLSPLAYRGEASITTLADLVIVCSNCHVMIHRGGQCRDITSLMSEPNG